MKISTGDPLETLKSLKVRFLNSITVPKNVKRGNPLGFLTSLVLLKIETNEGGPFGAIQKVFLKKVA